MILQALVEYYEVLSKDNKIPKYGWDNSKISYAIELDEKGHFLRLQSLMQEEQRGKKTKTVPRLMILPAAVKKSSGIASNFLFGNATYMFGLNSKGSEKKERALRCFDATKELHLSLLNSNTDTAAVAICDFFNSWDSESAEQDERLIPFVDDLNKGANLCFIVNDIFAQNVPSIQAAWNAEFGSDEADDVIPKMVDLITGDIVEPLKIHPAIKGILGAQSSGASLISFNAPADGSYGKEQNLNAPLGKYSAFAYTAALNYLLSQRDGDGNKRFSKMIGDTTLVYWSSNGEEPYQDVLSDLLDGGNKMLSNQDLQNAVTAICEGRPIDWSRAGIDPDNKFYLLGIAPNAARLSVRFAYCNTFGKIIHNINEHYRRMEIEKPSFEKDSIIPLWRMVSETANQKLKNSNPSPQLCEDILKAIVTGSTYPTTLYQQINLRIKADRIVNWRRASIIKAYFMRNRNYNTNEEVLTVKLNEETVYQPYVLGRLFSVLEAIQDDANPGINTTIKDKYFTSACATPSVIFPILLNLTEKHLKKLSTGKKIYYSQQLQSLLGKITESYPSHMTLDEQGAFQLGYYHQTQKRFTKKTEEN
jgi:CRISPR-associated protein Csd1